MIDSHDSSVPFRRPLGTTFMPSGEMVIVKTWPLCSSSRLMLLSSFVAMDVRIRGDEQAPRRTSKVISGRYGGAKYFSRSGRISLGDFEAGVHADARSDHADHEGGHETDARSS